jgi:hypothetical protein
MSLGTTFMPTNVAELGMEMVVESDNSTRVYLCSTSTAVVFHSSRSDTHRQEDPTFQISFTGRRDRWMCLHESCGRMNPVSTRTFSGCNQDNWRIDASLESSLRDSEPAVLTSSRCSLPCMTLLAATSNEDTGKTAPYRKSLLVSKHDGDDDDQEMLRDSQRRHAAYERRRVPGSRPKTFKHRGQASSQTRSAVSACRII